MPTQEGARERLARFRETLDPDVEAAVGCDLLDGDLVVGCRQLVGFAGLDEFFGVAGIDDIRQGEGAVGACWYRSRGFKRRRTPNVELHGISQLPDA